MSSAIPTELENLHDILAPDPETSTLEACY